jgi:hypothetical protein
MMQAAEDGASDDISARNARPDDQRSVGADSLIHGDQRPTLLVMQRARSRDEGLS